ncbi:hypothetical protein HCN44_010079 [Aphidius gifuensis]|uniref:Cytochrome P450 n=1 Tax=Aphidius gifuensis TaxID=684658 RepID=A0A835CS29_APHGI|nr:hypothetical protein HCN44_010079 [Aphidius gifuensis]
MTIHFNRKELKKLYETLVKHYVKLLKDPNFEKKILKGMYCNLLHVLTILYSINLLSYSIPVFDIIRQFISGVHPIQYKIYIPIKYPWYPISTHGFAYSIHCLIVSISCLTFPFATSSCDALFFLYMIKIIGHLRQLTYEMKNFNNNNNDEYHGFTRKIVIRHINVMHYCHQLEKIFGPLVLWFTISNAVFLVGATYMISQLSHMLSFGDRIQFFIFIIIKLFQVYTYGYFGSYLQKEDIDPLTANIVNIDGPRWKFIRAKLTPLFTTGKLKQMIELMVECADQFEIYLSNQLKKSNVIDCREVAAKFTTDVIGSCAFGINMNALSNDESEFRTVGRKLFESNFYTLMKRLFREISPQLFTSLKISLIDSKINKFFIDTINETIDVRKNNNIVRNDLIDLFINIKKTENNNEIQFTDSLMTAQAFAFFVGGFETSSTLISMSLYELAIEQKIQEKLRNEIIETLKNNDGQLSYDVINKTLRKDPPVSTLIRKACRSYKIPETNTTIEKGTNVNIPVYAIHHDPSYYPSPEKFDPERFTDSAKAQRHPMTLLAFGDGPKNCIGLRFAGYQFKLGIIKVLKNYIVKPSKSTVVPYEIDKGSVILTPKNGIHLVFEPL